MKNLDDIPKKNPYDVPDGYFDDLPGRIQSRIQGRERRHVLSLSHVARYAAAAAVLVLVAYVWVWRNNGNFQSQSPEAMLASMETADLIAYLNDGEFTTDELLDGIELSEDDITEIEHAVFDLNLGDMDLNVLTNEIQ